MLAELFASMQSHPDRDVLIWRDTALSYGELAKRVAAAESWLNVQGIGSGSVVHLDADFSPSAVVLLLSLLKRHAIVAVTTGLPSVKREELRALCQAQFMLTVNAQEDVEVERFTTTDAPHELLGRLQAAAHPGLIIFSSGSTGQSKAAVHDLLPLLAKFAKPGRTVRSLAFLLFDHIGGLNTLFYTLFNGGTVIIGDKRTPDAICAAIAQHRADALTTTPTFLRLILVSRAYERHDLSSLKIINYGTEVMPASTLAELGQLLPTVRLSQAYGLSEVGVLPVRSKASDSLFIKLGTDGVDTRIRDGLLEIRSTSAMLGYLNAASPFTEDGWFRTGDAVEIDGDYVRILGRASEMINVGGQKVYPAEVEGVLQGMPGVNDVVVSGEANALTGQIVKACITLSTDETTAQFAMRMRAYCKAKLPAYMIPQKVVFLDGPSHGQRFKKMRLQTNKEPSL